MRSKILAVIFVCTQMLYGSCAGSCGGCSPIFPFIVEASVEIEKEFTEAEHNISRVYRKQIVTTLESNKKLERKLAVLRAQIKSLEKVKLLTNIQIKQVLAETKAVVSTQDIKKDKKYGK